MARDGRLRLAFAMYNQAVAEATAWRLPDAAIGRSVDPAFLRQIVRTAERGVFDYFFIPSILSSSSPEDLAGGNDPFRIDPIPLASFAAAITSRIGLAVTVNTTYEHPFDVARATASLDHLSDGRAAVNLVAGAPGSEAASNYGALPHPGEDEKYDRAEEFIELLFALWGSWPEDWFEGDKARGRLVREGIGGAIGHHGRFFDVDGSLTLPPSPQGRPPIIHAGVSQRSRRFAAKYADIRFASFSEPRTAKAQYDEIKQLVAEEGRDPDSCFVIPGLTIYVDETRSGAREVHRRVLSASSRSLPSVSSAGKLGLDLDRVRPSDRVVGTVSEAALADAASLAARAIAALGDDRITLADLAHFEATEARGQPSFVGNVTDVADWIEQQFVEEVLDGVKFYPPYLPGPLDAIVTLVIPELQRRGLVRKDYDSATFREHFRLPHSLTAA